MAAGISFGLALLCSVWVHHRNYGLVPSDAQKGVDKHSGSSKMEVEQRLFGGRYDQEQFRPASGISDAAQSNVVLRKTSSNPYSQRPSLWSFDPSSYKSNPKSRFTSAQTLGKRIRPVISDFQLSDSIASGSSFSHKRNTPASRSTGQSVLNPSAVKPVSSWEVKRAHHILPHSSTSGLIPRPSQKSSLFNGRKTNSLTQTGIVKSKDVSKSSSGGSFKFPDFPSSAASNQKHSTGVATLRYGSTLSSGPKPYQSSHASASGNVLNSKQHVHTSSTVQKQAGLHAAVGPHRSTHWISTSARRPNQSISSSHGVPTWQHSGVSIPKRFAPTTTHDIPEVYGGSPIRRLKNTPPHNSNSAISKPSFLKVSEPQIDHSGPTRKKGPTAAYVRVQNFRLKPSP
ncbi:hypothetical protein DPEC_G00283550 [Dallia pectoralis]|uniref:Uncharacterized protein n=1 Tax=Dallia pectoralis TaxID=75939 RepID=A0ACC2FJF1_DALPE|nr:hypothetical protein DPEC_G00283550 [Dallia pectoralis]